MKVKQTNHPLRKGFNEALGWYVPRDDTKSLSKVARNKYSLTDKPGGSTAKLPYSVQVSLDFDCAV